MSDDFKKNLAYWIGIAAIIFTVIMILIQVLK